MTLKKTKETKPAISGCINFLLIKVFEIGSESWIIETKKEKK